MSIVNYPGKFKYVSFAGVRSWLLPPSPRAFSGHFPLHNSKKNISIQSYFFFFILINFICRPVGIFNLILWTGAVSNHPDPLPDHIPCCAQMPGHTRRCFLWFSHYWSFWPMSLRLKIFLKIVPPSRFLLVNICIDAVSGRLHSASQVIAFKIGPTLIGLLTLCVWWLNIRHFVLSTNLSKARFGSLPHVPILPCDRLDGEWLLNIKT